jgi:hypothetical protein
MPSGGERLKGSDWGSCCGLHKAEIESADFTETFASLNL